MTKTLYDPAVEQRGFEKGFKIGFEEGFKKGFEEGFKKGTEMIILLLLEQKLKSVPADYKEKIEKLSQEQLNKIAVNIFNIEKFKAIDKMLQ